MKKRETVCLAALLTALLAALTPVFAAQSPSATPAFSSQQLQLWLQHCPQLKQDVADSPLAAVTFTPLPPMPAAAAPAWKIEWHGLTIPVPALDYSHIGLSGKQHAFMLITDDSYGIFTGKPRGFEHGSAQRQTLLQALWGPQATLGQVIAYGYTITPEDLDCDSNDLKTQARNAMALSLKTIAGPTDIVAMYQLPGWQLGLLEHGHTDESMLNNSSLDSYRYLLQDDFDHPPSKVLYRLPSGNAELRATGLMLAHSQTVSYTAAPNWLQRLQAYLDKPTQATRCALVGALRHANFDAKSIKHIATQTPACTG